MLKNIVKGLKPSSTLAINESSKQLEEEGKKIFKFGFEMGDYISEFKIENSERPSKNIVYPIALILLVICGYFNIRRKE